MARSRLLLMRVVLRRVEQLARLMIAERRRLAFAAFRLRPLDAFDRVMRDGVLLAQIFEQRGERREPVPDRAAAKPAPHQLVAPGDDVRARHGAKFLRPRDAGEAHEVLHRVLVGAAAEQADRQVRTLCMTLAFAGCRLSEALALTVDSRRPRGRPAGAREPEETPQRHLSRRAGAARPARGPRPGARHPRTAGPPRQGERRPPLALEPPDRLARRACCHGVVRTGRPPRLAQGVAARLRRGRRLGRPSR